MLTLSFVALVLFLAVMVGGRYLRKRNARRSAPATKANLAPAQSAVTAVPPPLPPAALRAAPPAASTALVKREAQYEPVYVVNAAYSAITRPGTIFIAQSGSAVRAVKGSTAIVLNGAQGIAEPGSLVLAEIGARAIDAGGQIQWMPAGAWDRQFQSLN